MERQVIESILQETRDFDFGKQTLITKEIREKYSVYFSKVNQGPTNEKIISDESLFRDYSRLGDRKVDFERVRNPFNLSKYTISSYEKTWYIKHSDDNIEGPMNSYEMDALFKKGKIKKHTKIGINNSEYFRFDYFVEIVYPLPRVKSHMNQGGAHRIRNVNYTSKFDNLSNIDETYSQTNRSVRTGNRGTPFKRTPFKVMPTEIAKMETVVRENISTDNNSKWFGAWSTSKKNHNQKSVQMVGETFLVKSKTKNKNRYMPRSSKDHFKLEMNDIIGNYTAIKKDKDSRKYVDLSKKIDFQVKVDVNVVKEETEPVNIDEFDFDNIEFSKKD